MTDRAPLSIVPRKRLPLYCSFCGKEKDDVAYLVAGPTVFICNECVELCREVGTEMLVENAVRTDGETPAQKEG